MDAATIEVLRRSFARIAELRPDVTAVFYERLFEVAPSVRPLFTTDMEEQQRKLLYTLVTIVECVDKPEKLMNVLSTLGQRHVKYGAKPEHYDVVGSVLLWTFEKVLGPEFTPDVRQAWTEAYGVVANTMRAAAASSTASARAAAAGGPTR
jgi:hemoglobin-like flavoprotein